MVKEILNQICNAIMYLFRTGRLLCESNQLLIKNPILAAVVYSTAKSEYVRYSIHFVSSANHLSGVCHEKIKSLNARQCGHMLLRGLRDDLTIKNAIRWPIIYLFFVER